jgi:hypothetical protein
LTRIAGRLGSKIIGRTVNDNGFSQNIPHGKPIGKKSGKGSPPVSEQRGHIARMVGMGTAIRIIMTARIGKRIGGSAGAAVSAMNMKSEHRRLTPILKGRQPDHLSAYDHSAARLVKSDRTPNGRVSLIASHHGYPLGGSAKQQG